MGQLYSTNYKHCNYTVPQKYLKFNFLSLFLKNFLTLLVWMRLFFTLFSTIIRGCLWRSLSKKESKTLHRCFNILYVYMLQTNY